VLDKEDLSRIPLFSKLNEEEIGRCVDSSEELLLRKGEEFITEGKPADYFYVLLSGRVQVTKTHRMAVRDRSNRYKWIYPDRS
jgi:signal-transduction protein with cAMP-binding, CBS, and nucleotidyltransferase domain